MLENIFKGLFDTESTQVISVTNFMICIIGALIVGFIIAAMYTYKNKYTKSFIATLAVLPAVVCAVIMMVNGNIGVGVAVTGAFGLIRFRSMPGTAKEIGVIFLAMGTGLIMGMGYIAYGFLFAVIISVVNMAYSSFNFGENKQDALSKTVRVTIPEDLDYTQVFDDIFEKYTQKNELVNVKTTNMGSLFKLTYNLTLRDKNMEKPLIDDMRCRNGNLEIMVSGQETAAVNEL